MNSRHQVVTGTFIIAAAMSSIACGASDPDQQTPYNPGAGTGGATMPGLTGGTNAGVGGVMGGGGVTTGQGGSVQGTGGVVTSTGGAPGSGGGIVGQGGAIVPGSGGAVGTTGGMTGSGGGPTPDPGCNLHTKYAGDANCILPPPADQGFQLHYGPTDYDNPTEVAKYLVPPGQDTTVQGHLTSPNASAIYFYRRQYRMRPGSHHMIVYGSGGQGGVLGTGRRLGGTQNQVKDNPTGPIPPENEGIGMKLDARTGITLDLHHYNGTDEPILREAWINFWYVDPATVKKEAKEMFLMAQGPTIAPNQRVVVKGQRTASAAGRILTAYGHRHSNNVRFSAWLTRGTDKKLIYEDYDWKEPKVLEFNTLTTNPAPDPAKLVGGGFTGVLDVKAGDTVSWECEIVNKSGATIIFNQNEAVTSEMCILIGDTTDVAFPAF